MLGLATLTRPAALLVPLVLVVLLPWVTRNWRRALAQAAPLLAIFILVLAPWIWRGWRLFGAWIPASTLGGVNLYISHYALDQDDYLTAHRSEGAKRMIIWTRVIENEPGSLDEAELDRVFRDKAMVLIRRYPLRYLHLALNRFLRLWFNLGYAGGLPSVWSWMVACTNGSLLILGFVALVKERGQAARLAGVLWGLLAYFTLFHAAVLAYVRFIFPVIPLVLVLAARGVSLLVGTKGKEKGYEGAS